MEETLRFAANAALIGGGATAVMDGWAIFQSRVLGVPTLNYALVGRWIAGLPRGRFVRRTLGADPPAPGEAAIGWGAHYAIGILFAAGLLAVWGPEWARRPGLEAALIVGLATVAAPFLILQPGMGLGIAASRAPRPTVARLRSLRTHLVVGLGLYLSALLLGRLGGPV